MSQATPQMRDFAEHLIAYEARRSKPSETIAATAFSIIDRLRPNLATLMGNVGFRALLSRALALASAEVPWLRAMHVRADGSLEGLDELGARLTPGDVFEGRAVLVAQVLGLLVAFIGKDLTMLLVREVWPKLPVNHFDAGQGGQNEKA